MPEALLALEGVTLRAPDGTPVFRDLAWRLARGGRFQLSGFGATAFLRLCCGIAEPEAGQVLLGGTPLASYRRHPFLERGAVGYVPSDGGLAVNLTLLDNVALPLRFALHQNRAEAAANAALWLGMAGLAEQALQRPRVPADGQSWLASLARAAAKKPELWLVDRPSGGLDHAAMGAAQDLLAQAGADPAVTMVLVGGPWASGLGEALRLEAGRIGSGGLA